MSNETYTYTLAGQERQVARLKGKTARLSMMKLLALLTELMVTAKGMGLSLEAYFSADKRAEIFADKDAFGRELTSILLSATKILNSDYFERLEGLLPIILDCPPELLEEEGDLVGVYSAAFGALLFHVNTNMTGDASAATQNFSERLEGLTQPAVAVKAKK